jgi:hypothetical protein
MTPAGVVALVRDDMAALGDARVSTHVDSLLVTPPRPLRVWVARYSGEVYEGFLVLSHPSGVAVVYCPRDYEPVEPWGLVGISNESPTSEPWCYGDWYPRFLDAYFDSKAASDVDIWRVRERRLEREPAWVSDELPWDVVWQRVYALRAASPECQYDCEHSVTY